jgi:hypothetical protein
MMVSAVGTALYPLVMLHELRIALAATVLALAAVSAVDSASALRAGYAKFGGYDRGGYEYRP